MRRFALVLGIILLGAAPANAAPPSLNRDFHLATIFWGERPPCASIELIATAHLELEGVIGEATHGEHCRIAVTRTLAEPWRCAVVIHEDGHLFGFEHSTDPRNIMYAGPTMPIPGICKRRGV
jgi:hypothetical protein